MRSIPSPAIDDFAALDDLKKSPAAAAKAIRGSHLEIQSQFLAYIAAGGDPWQVLAAPALAPLRPHFEDLYDSPPKAISYIKPLRKQSLTGACPMCGRDNLGTLDHYLPQSTHPEFCFLSKNLVPACSRCNTARGNAVQGGAAGQRALHPYFDAFASQRVMSIRLVPDWRAPEITPVPFNVNGQVADIIQWQIDNVVVPSGFVDYAAPIWGTLVNEPKKVLGNVSTVAAVRARLQQLEDDDAALSKSENSWRSCIFHGIRMDAGAVGFLVNTLAAALAL